MAAKEIHSIAILGAGAGGCACAADLTLRGYDVRLHARSERRLGLFEREVASRSQVVSIKVLRNSAR